MTYEVIVTCAVTGAGDTTSKHLVIPVTPRQIAEAAIKAERAGALRIATSAIRARAAAAATRRCTARWWTASVHQMWT